MKASFDGPWFGLLEIMIKNFFLRIVTLGIYHPWARVNVRRFFWRHTMLDNERFEFIGDGWELFIGLAQLMCAVLLVGFVTLILHIVNPLVGQIWQIVIAAVYFFIIPYFIYSARRYLLSRTKWRGIRFGLSRVRREYMIAFIAGAVASVLTLGLAIPWARFRTHKILTEATMWGGVPMIFEGRLSDYFKIYLKAAILLPLTLGLYYPWFSAEISNYNFNNTKFDEAKFSLNLRGMDLLGIYLVTIVVSMMTFGLGVPWAMVYRMKYLTSKFSVEGKIDFDMIHQMAPAADAMADSLVDYFDLDLGW